MNPSCTILLPTECSEQRLFSKASVCPTLVVFEGEECELKCIITAHVAKQAKVMFSQACVNSTLGGGVGNHEPGHKTSFPPHTRLQHLLPPLWQGHKTSLPPPFPWGQCKVGGTHPTGMHYCWIGHLVCWGGKCLVGFGGGEWGCELKCIIG